MLDWGARHEAERSLAEEREAARRRHRRLARIVGLALVGLALMGLLTAYAFTQRSDAREKAALAAVTKAGPSNTRSVAKSEPLRVALAKAELSEAGAIDSRNKLALALKGEARQRKLAHGEPDRANAGEAKANREAERANRERDAADVARAKEAMSKNEAMRSKTRRSSSGRRRSVPW